MSGNRRRSRELALKLIYSMQDQSESVDAALGDFWGHFRFQEDLLGDPLESAELPVSEEVKKFTEELVYGVSDHLEEIDEAITNFSTNWTLERMARVDLSLLRLGAFELLYRPDIPVNVAINEAVEIGKRFGTKDTPAFVNGILDKLSRSP
ncbi:MAG: transcription antitermination factor NusB, partial [Candidatus Zixiibacteriota bacterium]